MSIRPATVTIPIIAYSRYLRLVLRLLPYYGYHLLVRPYRRGQTTSIYRAQHISRRRFREALYDAGCTLILGGYSEATGRRVRVETAGLLFLMMVFTGRFDDQFERLIRRGESANIDDVMDASEVRGARDALLRFLQVTGTDSIVMTHVENWLRSHYDEYIATVRDSEKSHSFASTLRTAEIDAGEFAVTVARSIAIFNAHAVPDSALQDCYEAGMALKLADDIADLAYDISLDAPNLVYALARRDAAEFTALRAGLSMAKRRNLAWWRANCPRTIEHYCLMVNEYYRKIGSPKLRYLCELRLTAALLGLHLKRIESDSIPLMPRREAS